MNKLLSVLTLCACTLNINVAQAALFDRDGDVITSPVPEPATI